MAHDVATVILDKVHEMDVKEREAKRRTFIETALDNHYNVCIESISNTVVPNHPSIHRHCHHGCRSFYVVDGDIYISTDDVFKPTKFVNVTKNYDKVFNSIVHHFKNYTCHHDENTLCLRMILTVPVYTHKSGKKWYFRYWDTIDTLEYDKDTSEAEILQDVIGFLSSVESKIS